MVGVLNDDGAAVTHEPQGEVEWCRVGSGRGIDYQVEAPSLMESDRKSVV